MVRLGGVAFAGYIPIFQGIRNHFLEHDIDLDWVLYRDWDALVDAFVDGEVDLAWNGPLAYVKIKHRLTTPCQVVAMRDTDVYFATQFITRPDSDITTMEDLHDRTFAFASRGSVHAGLLAHYFLSRDLQVSSFFEERGSDAKVSDEVDVIQRVASGEFDAGSVCKRTLDDLRAKGDMPEVRVFWSSPAYSHCCFSAQGDMDPDLARKITDAFVTISDQDADGKAVLDGEHCSYFVPGMTEGWDFLEEAAVTEGVI